MTVKQFTIDKGGDFYESQLLSGDFEVAVGVLAEDSMDLSEDGDITLYDKAIRNEYGIGVPKRAFMRASFEVSDSELKRQAQRIDNEVFNGRQSYESGLDEIGERHKQQIQTVIANGRDYFDLNSVEWSLVKKGTPETVTPLIYTGQLRTSINFKVRKNGKS